MPHPQRVNMITSTVPRNGKNSLTFENVVCTQLELQRRAASFSHRRSTKCRQPSNYRMSSSSSSSNRLSSSSNRITLLVPHSNVRISTSGTSDIPAQFLKTRNSNFSKHSRTSSMNSFNIARISNATDRQSFISMFYWDTLSRSGTSKKVRE